VGDVIGIYLKLYRSRVRSQLQYRLSFTLQVVGMLGATFLDFLVILVVFSRLTSLGGWSLWEVAFLYGASYLPFKLADIFVGKVERLGEWIRTGQFDSVLVRPLGTLGQTLTADMDLKQVGGLAQGAAVFGVALAHVEIDWSPARALMLVVMLASGFVIFCSVWIATNATAFWLVNVREATNAFTYGGNYLTQFPLDILGPWFRRVFAFLIPLAFVNYFPSLFLLGKPSEPWPAVLRFTSPLVAVATAVVAVIVWRAGIRHYSSTGS
jgi:viologen exporter family transport system permease protein